MSNATTAVQNAKVEVLKDLRDDPAFGLVSLRPESIDGTILYEHGAERVDGEPTIEIPHADPHLVDESDLPGGTTPSTTFDDLVADYGCRAREIDDYTYITVIESELRHQIDTSTPLLEEGESTSLDTPTWRSLDVTRITDDDVTGEVFFRCERDGDDQTFDLERTEIQQLALLAGFTVEEDPGDGDE